MELSEIRIGTVFSDVHALVDAKTVAITKTGKAYADIVLKSGNVSIKCKKWSYNSDKYDNVLVVGKTVRVSGEASEYLGELQATLNTIDPSGRSPDEFARRTKYNVEEIYAHIKSVVDSFNEPLPKYIANRLLTKYKKEFCSCPAALGVHQAWFGGLIEHTYNMLSIAMPIVNFYQKTYGVEFSKDKVLFGIIVHDLGKIFEYDSSTPVFKMKPEGILLNHIVRGAILIHEMAGEWRDGSDSDDFTVVPKQQDMSKEAFERERDILAHLLVSHHGKKEYGSPMLPATLEAILIHHIDMIDSHFTPAVELVQGKQGNVQGFSERCRIEKTQYLQKPT